LQREERLLPLVTAETYANGGDQCTAGLNFVTLRPRERILADYGHVVAATYEPDRYFARLQSMAMHLRRPKHAARFDLGICLKLLGALGRLCWQMTVVHRKLRGPFWRSVFHVLRHNPSALELVLIQAAFYLHLGPFSRFVVEQIDRKIGEATTVAAQGTVRTAVVAAQ
jgi:hypothetical protein